MKIKSLFIAICSTTLLFTSCEKAEMDKGIGGGGGLLVDNYSLKTPATPLTITTTTNKTKAAATSINVLRSVDVNSNLGQVKVLIVDAVGKTVLSTSVNVSQTNDLLLDRSQFAKGTYNITITAQNGTVIQQDSFTVE